MYPAVEFRRGDLGAKSLMVIRRQNDLTGSGCKEHNTLRSVFYVVLGFLVECGEAVDASYGYPHNPFI